MHLANYSHPAKIPYTNFNFNDWIEVNQSSFLYYDDMLIRAPVQYNLGQFKPSLKEKFKNSFLNRGLNKPAECLKEHLIQSFGFELASNILIPQNEKTLGIDISKISKSALGRFLPKPNIDVITKGFESEENSNTYQTYNSKFWYPKEGGIEKLTESLAKNLKSVKRYCKITAVDIENKILYSSRGDTFSFDTLISTIPLKILGKISKNKLLGYYSENLSNSTTVSFCFGFKGKVPKKLEHAHWVYFPQKDIPFYRLGIFSNIAQRMCPEGYYSFYVEASLDSKATLDKSYMNSLTSKVINSLESLGWFNMKDLEVSVQHPLTCAYVHLKLETANIVVNMQEVLSKHNIISTGRYGLWTYCSMEESILMGLKVGDL